MVRKLRKRIETERKKGEEVEDCEGERSKVGREMQDVHG